MDLVTYLVQMVSTIHYSLKGASLKIILAVGTIGKNYIPSIQGRNKEPLIAHVQFLCPADDPLQKYFRLKVFFTSISLPLYKKNFNSHQSYKKRGRLQNNT